MGRVASQSTTRRWDGSLCVSAEDVPALHPITSLIGQEADELELDKEEVSSGRACLSLS
jgi:hypothetical protein